MGKILLTNTLSKQKEPFEPLEPGKVKIYACGVTVYDKLHLGHGRSALVQDTFRRFFHALGWQVTFVKNFTDIDDKIIERAKKDHIPWQELTAKMIELHDQTMANFGVLPPDHAPKATEHLPEMFDVIQRLLERDLAYNENGDIFFRTGRFQNYGALSGKKISELIPGYRVSVQAEKQAEVDFVLWKKAKPAEPSFESPWGKGRPGWHIECSAMSTKFLGQPFDIHMGGTDLIFPHHENEIAQSESAFQQKYVRYWLHNEMVRVEGQKMSKSLGNFIELQDLLDLYGKETLRFYLLQTHYRQVVDFRPSAIQGADQALQRLYSALAKQPGALTRNPADKAEAYYQAALDCLKEDLNTPKLIALLFEWAKKVQKTDDPTDMTALQTALKKAGALLGILAENPAAFLQRAPTDLQGALAENSLSNEEIEHWLTLRTQARAGKDWQEADRIRDFLLAKGVKLIDQEGKTTWQQQRIKPS